MHADRVLYRRLAQESLGTLEPGLRAWTLALILGRLSWADRLRERNDALRAAGDFLEPSFPGVGERAAELRRLMLAARRSVQPAHPQPDTVAGCIALAFLARDKVPSTRQIWRILEGEGLDDGAQGRR